MSAAFAVAGILACYGLFGLFVWLAARTKTDSNPSAAWLPIVLILAIMAIGIAGVSFLDVPGAGRC